MCFAGPCNNPTPSPMRAPTSTFSTVYLVEPPFLVDGRDDFPKWIRSKHPVTYKGPAMTTRDPDPANWNWEEIKDLGEIKKLAYLWTDLSIVDEPLKKSGPLDSYPGNYILH